MQEAIIADVTRMISVGTNVIESKNCIRIAEKFDAVYATVAIHPHDCKNEWQQEFNELKKLITHPKVVAIGETGLDFHYSDYNATRQKDAFKQHIELALEHDLALVVHTRDAIDETMKILEEFQYALKHVVMHCFSEDLNIAQEAVNMGFLLGIAGHITYPKNDRLRNIVTTLGLEKIILETDAPFLPPQNIRGQQNSPKQIATIAHYIAQLLNVSFETVAEITTKNALGLFQLNNR